MFHIDVCCIHFQCLITDVLVHTTVETEIYCLQQEWLPPLIYCRKGIRNVYGTILLQVVCFFQVLEVVDREGKCVRCDGAEGVREFVQAAQQHAMLLHHLKRYILYDNTL